MFRRGGRGLAAKLVVPSRAKYFVGVALILAPVVYTAAGVARNGPDAPLNHDAFSHLFAAETFAEGRISNPPHPLWEFFETFHILSKPARVSKFPFAQGLMLAVGEVILGRPWMGVLLSVLLMLAALYWALRAWLPPHWALLGTTLSSIHFGANHYWIDSYWGGAVAAIGGCLLFGVLGRLHRRPADQHLARYGLVTALGLSVLANSRPWEGLLLSAAVLGYIIPAVLFSDSSSGQDRWRRLVRYLAPCLVGLSLTAAMMAYYNARTSGSWNVMPYTVYQSTYSIEKIFPWESKPTPPKYNHEVMRDFFTSWEPRYQGGIVTGSLAERLLSWLILQLNTWSDLTSSPTSLLIVLAYLPYLVRNRRSRPVVLILSMVTLGVLLQRYHNPHYQSPLLAGFVLLKILTIRKIAHSTVEASMIGLAAILLVVGDAGIGWTFTHWSPEPGHCLAARPLVDERLKRGSKRDLVVVRYSSDHSPHCEWVYNEPDIDAAEVVWAREMTPERNCELTRYFNEREVWLLEPDADDPGPKPAPDWCAPE